jgi:hypothetical protein
MKETYQYKVVDIQSHDDTEGILNRIGSEGFELYKIISIGDKKDTFRYFFMKRVVVIEGKSNQIGGNVL